MQAGRQADRERQTDRERDRQTETNKQTGWVRGREGGMTKLVVAFCYSVTATKINKMFLIT